MDILQHAQALQDHFDGRETALVAKEREHQGRVAQLDDRERSLDERAKQLTDRSAELDKRQQGIQGVEDDITRAAQLRDLMTRASKKQAELARKENDLADIHENQTQREAEVARREREVAAREVDYKERLKKEFFAEVAKRLPQ